MIQTCQQEMGGRLMVYKVLGCRDFITLLLFLHHKWSSQTERFCTCCGSCVWHSFIAAYTQLEGDSSIHRLRYYSPPKSQSMAMDTKYVLSHWTVLLCGWGSWYFSVSSHTPLSRPQSSELISSLIYMQSIYNLYFLFVSVLVLGPFFPCIITWRNVIRCCRS